MGKETKQVELCSKKANKGKKTLFGIKAASFHERYVPS